MLKSGASQPVAPSLPRETAKIGNSGYTKDYWYDDRLKYRNPPLFLDPVNAAWGILRETEQLPPR